MLNQNIIPLVTKIREEKPLVLNITNLVTMDFIANGLLSLGASPVMSHAVQESEDLLKIASAVVINLGTLNDEFIHLAEQICRIANELGKPIILDPVGAGASRYRTEAALNLIQQYQISIIRGNASEIMSLAHSSQSTRGVDSTEKSHAAIKSAGVLSNQYNAAVVVSGKMDIIIDQLQLQQFERGSAWMPMITGTGCLLSSVVAAFHAVEHDRFTAASTATLFYSLCGELAEKSASAPGTFKTHFQDALSSDPREWL